MPLTTQDMILFFISSVLVSAENAIPVPKAGREIKSRNKSTSSSDGEDPIVEDEPAGIEDIELREVGAPAQMLNSRWTFWFQNSDNVKKCANKEDYLKELKRGGTFHTIPNFWKSWNECLELCNVRSDGDVSYHLFKTGIKPLYEDPQNFHGGKWIVVTPRSTPMEFLIKQWVSLMLSLLINEWGLENEICGAVLSVRPWGNMFTIWNKNANNKKEIELIGERLREHFGMDDIKYQRHQTKLKKLTNHKSRPSRRSDDSRSNSDVSSEEEQDRSGRTSPVSQQDVKDEVNNIQASRNEEIDVGRSLPQSQPEPLVRKEEKKEETILPSEVKKDVNAPTVKTEEISVQNEEKMNKRRKRKAHRKKSTSSTTSSSEEEFVESQVENVSKAIASSTEEVPIMAKIGFGIFVAASVATGLLRFIY